MSQSEAFLSGHRDAHPDEAHPDDYGRHVGEGHIRPTVLERMGIPNMSAKHRAAPPSYQYFGERGLPAR